MVRHPDLGDVSRYVLKQDLSGCCMENAREKDWRPGSQRRGHCRSLKDEGVPGARAGIPNLVFIIFLSLPSHRNLVDILFQIACPSPRNFSTIDVVHMFTYCGLRRATNHCNMYGFLFLTPESQFSPLWG